MVKFAMILGDPLQPGQIDGWMKPLLKDKTPTFKNKLDAVLMQGVNKKFIEDKKAKIEHPEMSTYKKVMLRVRAVSGFHCWDLLHRKVVEEVGRRGFAHKPLPLTSSILLDPAILTSEAFAAKGEKDLPARHVAKCCHAVSAVVVKLVIIRRWLAKGVVPSGLRSLCVAVFPAFAPCGAVPPRLPMVGLSTGWWPIGMPLCSSWQVGLIEYFREWVGYWQPSSRMEFPCGGTAQQGEPCKRPWSRSPSPACLTSGLSCAVAQHHVGNQ